MTDRITLKNIQGALEALNCLTKDNYKIEQIFNGFELYHEHTQGLHGSIVCYATTKNEMFQKIHDLKTLLIIEQQNKPTEYEKQTKQELQKKGYYVSSLKGSA